MYSLVLACICIVADNQREKKRLHGAWGERYFRQLCGHDGTLDHLTSSPASTTAICCSRIPGQPFTKAWDPYRRILDCTFFLALVDDRRHCDALGQ
jgi:hypothetical protein